MVDFTNKTVIAEYRWKYFLYAAICWITCGIGFFRFNHADIAIQYILVLIVISVLALYLTIALIHPRFVFIGRKGPLYNDFMNFKHDEIISASNNFKFTPEGFTATLDQKQEFIKWSEISRIEASLEDALQNDDEVVLSIYYGNNKVLNLDEESAGWLYFAETLPKYINGISVNWVDEFLKSGNTRTKLWAA